MVEINNKKEFRLYKPTKSGTGCASAWSCRWGKRPNKEQNELLVFVKLARQIAGQDANGNDKFDWKEGSIDIKLGIADLAELLAVARGHCDSVGGERGKLYHQTKNGNKAISFAYNKERNNYYFGVTTQNADKSLGPKLGHSISQAEVEVLETLISKAVVSMYGW